LPKTLDNFIEKCSSHADYQHFVVTNFRKYYPDPDALARSTWDIIERFWNLDLSFTDTFMADKYSKFGPAPAKLPVLMPDTDALFIWL